MIFSTYTVFALYSERNFLSTHFSHFFQLLIWLHIRMTERKRIHAKITSSHSKANENSNKEPQNWWTRANKKNRSCRRRRRRLRRFSFLAVKNIHFSHTVSILFKCVACVCVYASESPFWFLKLMYIYMYYDFCKDSLSNFNLLFSLFLTHTIANLNLILFRYD